LAFQILDDILDVTATSKQLGKSAGKDLKASKATYPAAIGLEKSRIEASRLTARALSSLRSPGLGGERLEGIAALLLSRER
jgi:geranylgeranyl diphosphate synthase type II